MIDTVSRHTLSLNCFDPSALAHSPPIPGLGEVWDGICHRVGEVYQIIWGRARNPATDDLGVLAGYRVTTRNYLGVCQKCELV